MLVAVLEVAADMLSKQRTEQPRTAPPPAPTCINAFSLTSVPTFLLANLDA